MKLEYYELLQDYTDVFLKEVPWFLPKRDIDVSTNLVPRVAPTSKDPYRMGIP